MVKRGLTLVEYFEEIYLPSKLDLAETAASQYRITVRMMDRWNGGPVLLREIDKHKILQFLRCLRDLPRSERTCNNKRQHLLAIWRHAYEEGFVNNQPPFRLARYKEKDPAPTAWSPEEVQRLIHFARNYRSLKWWTGQHWESLILVIYDTSLRISCLLETKRNQIEGEYLRVLAEHQKAKRETVQRLHPSTLNAISGLPPHEMLFPFPYRKESLWYHFRKILQNAGLPNTRRDLFHKLRRTSYTFVYRELGLQAASEHASHSSDMSRFYLDKTKLKQVETLSVLPRP